MDYAYYSAQAQPYQFSGFPPTPAQSYEAQDDPMLDAQDVYQNDPGFPGYDATYQFPADGFLPPQHQQVPPGSLHEQSQSPSNSNHRPSVAPFTPGDQTNGSLLGPANGEGESQEINNGSPGDSDERDNLTPQQSRRKAQNRAAQRAFRERKERHVKELESKLNSLSAHSSSLLSDNERLKKELQRLATQNEILRATALHPASIPRPPSPVHGPQKYSPTDFVTAVEVDLHGRPISYDSFDSVDGQRLLAAGAAWDMIQGHELFRRGMVDIAEVVRRLKGKAACDGRGPAFKEVEVIRAIEESALSGGDELI